ncbi:MAG: polysaccharide export protein, partial [Bacteroidetes bacterium]|nr:polysaccharide export protein [Bacteroidota bacterium]
PGLVTILNEKADVIDALSLAGDLTDFGNPKRIKVIRGELDNNPTVFLIDLTQTKSLGTSGFHLMPNDIIYVEPINRKFLITNLTTVVSVVSILNIIFLGLNVIKLYSK